MDVNDLLAGSRFEEELNKALAECDVFIPIIGVRWMDLLKARQRSKDRDYVREEIAEALKRRIIFIPVRVGRDGQLPPLPRDNELPAEIRDLARYQKHDVTHEHFPRDLKGLHDAITSLRMRGQKRFAPHQSTRPEDYIERDSAHGYLRLKRDIAIEPTPKINVTNLVTTSDTDSG